MVNCNQIQKHWMVEFSVLPKLFCKEGAWKCVKLIVVSSLSLIFHSFSSDNPVKKDTECCNSVSYSAGPEC
jgi:hypothetical protein